MNKLSQQGEEIRTARAQRILWLADNPGVITRIAEACDLSQPFVSDVFHGRRSSRGGAVEARLAQLGAPGFAVSQNDEPTEKVPAA